MASTAIFSVRAGFQELYMCTRYPATFVDGINQNLSSENVEGGISSRDFLYTESRALMRFSRCKGKVGSRLQ